MEIDNNKVVATLRTVIDPQSGNDIVSMKMVRDLKIADDRIHFL